MAPAACVGLSWRWRGHHPEPKGRADIGPALFSWMDGRSADRARIRWSARPFQDAQRDRRGCAGHGLTDGRRSRGGARDHQSGQEAKCPATTTHSPHFPSLADHMS